MEKINRKMDQIKEDVDMFWKKQSIDKQRKFTLYFFVTYLILTISLLIKVWYDMQKSDNQLQLNHIENPLIKKNRDREPKNFHQPINQKI